MTTNEKTCIDGLRKARRAQEYARRDVLLSRRQMQAAVRRAHECGMPKTKIADVSGISRMSVYAIIRES